jgi:hypothetical protein
VNPAFATAIFYGLLGLAWLLLRGSFAMFHDGVSLAVAFAACVIGLTIWAVGWQSPRPRARPVTGREPRPNWRQFSLLFGLVAVLLALFVGPLPWLAEKFAVPVFVPGDRPRENGAGPASAEPSLSPLTGTSSPGDSTTEAAASAATPDSSAGSALSRAATAIALLPRWLLFLLLSALLMALWLVGWLAWRLLMKRAANAKSKVAGTPTGDQRAPRYLREFRRLCREWGCPPDPGLTVRELIGRLECTGRPTAPFEPMAAYHYRVFYEDAPAQPHEEEYLRRAIRRTRRQRPSATRTVART